MISPQSSGPVDMGRLPWVTLSFQKRVKLSPCTYSFDAEKMTLDTLEAQGCLGPVVLAKY